MFLKSMIVPHTQSTKGEDSGVHSGAELGWDLSVCLTVLTHIMNFPLSTVGGRYMSSVVTFTVLLYE